MSRLHPSTPPAGRSMPGVLAARSQRWVASLLPCCLLVSQVAFAQDKPAPMKGPLLRGPVPTLSPGMRDRTPLQIREKDGRLNPQVPLRNSPVAAGNAPTPPPTVAKTPPQDNPVVQPSAPAPPLPGATSITGGAASRVEVAQVDDKGGADRTAADVDRARREKGKALFNFENAQLIDVVKQISKLTGRNFILRENLKGQKLTILCEEAVTSREAYRAFLVALEINNLAVVPAGKFYKIEERKNSIKQIIPTYFDDEGVLPGDEQMVTYIHRLKYVELDQAQRLVDSMLNKAQGDLQVYQPNLLIMSDAAINISRIKKLLDKVDVASQATRIHFIDVKYAPVADIANKLTTLLDPNKAAQKKTPVPGSNAPPEGGAAAQPQADGSPAPAPAPAEDLSLDSYQVTKIIADERTNKLILVAPPESFEKLKKLVEMLDVPEGPSSSPLVHVHSLENADAEKLTAALNNLAQASKKPADAKKKGASSEGMFEGEVKVTADPPTNSLVIVASQRDYKNLLKVIRKLDVRRPQVFVEAVIMEVSLNRTTDLGLDWFTAYQAPIPGAGNGVGIMANPGGQGRIKGALTTATADPTGLASFLGFLAFRGPSIPVTGSNGQKVDLPSFGAVLNALEQDGNVDVLSTPHILTTDNVKAEILVGQTVPFASGFSSAASGIASFAPIVSVQRQDVALKFIVTPHVNTSNFVRLEMDQEVSDLGDSVEVAPGQRQPTTTKRTAKTTIVVKDEQTVIIGGLISDKKINSESKVPILGDIPWLGFLFRTPHVENRKTNLMIILTPHIIRADEDFRRIYERKLRERQEFMEAFYGVYTPYGGPVDYERKVGPYGALHSRIKDEMMKVENGGPGTPGESIIKNDEPPEPAAGGVSGDGEAEGAVKPSSTPGEGGEQKPATPPEGAAATPAAPPPEAVPPPAAPPPDAQ